MQRFFSTALVVLLTVAAASAADDMKALFVKPQEVAGWSISRDITVYKDAGAGENAGIAKELLTEFAAGASADAVYLGVGDNKAQLFVLSFEKASEAFGLFSCLKAASGGAGAAIGQGAYTAAESAGAWKDGYVFIVKPVGESKVSAETFRAFLEAATRKLKTEGSVADICRAMETIGYVAGTTRYLHSNAALEIVRPISPKNALDLSAETDVVIAQFFIDERRFDGFIIRYPKPEKAAAAASKYSTFLGVDPDVEAAWFQQYGRTIVGTWTGLAVTETDDSEYMLFDTIKELRRQIRIFQLQK